SFALARWWAAAWFSHGQPNSASWTCLSPRLDNLKEPDDFYRVGDVVDLPFLSRVDYHEDRLNREIAGPASRLVGVDPTRTEIEGALQRFLRCDHIARYADSPAVETHEALRRSELASRHLKEFAELESCNATVIHR